MWSRARTFGAAVALVASIWIGARCIRVFSEVQAIPRRPAPTRVFGNGYYSWAIEQRIYINEGMNDAIAIDLINRVWTPQSIVLGLVALGFALVGVRRKRPDQLVCAVAAGWVITMFILSYRFASHYL